MATNFTTLPCCKFPHELSSDSGRPVLRHPSGPCQISLFAMLPAKVAGCRQEHSITFLHLSRGLTRGAPLSFPPARHSPHQCLRSQRLRLYPCSATSKSTSWLKRLFPGFSAKGDNAKDGEAPLNSPSADVDNASQSPHADDSKPAAPNTDAVTEGAELITDLVSES